jgi:hypothetical protein
VHAEVGRPVCTGSRGELVFQMKISRACWTAGLLVTCVAVAFAAPDLRKPAPDAQAQPYRERLVALIEGRYPHLLTQRIAGTATVTFLFDADGTLAGSNLELLSAPVSLLTASEVQFARFGLSAGELKYIGVSRISLPLNTVLVVFGGRDSRELDLALVEHFFPKIPAQGVPRGFGIWILFDHEGHVLRTGQERFGSRDLRKMLETRFPGIRTSDMTVTPVPAVPGSAAKLSSSPVLLHCVWLAVQSPAPGR